MREGYLENVGQGLCQPRERDSQPRSAAVPPHLAATLRSALAWIGCGALAVLAIDAMLIGAARLFSPAEVAAAAVGARFERGVVMEKIRAGASITGVYPFSDEAKREYQAWK